MNYSKSWVFVLKRKPTCIQSKRHTSSFCWFVSLFCSMNVGRAWAIYTVGLYINVSYDYGNQSDWIFCALTIQFVLTQLFVCLLMYVYKGMCMSVCVCTWRPYVYVSYLLDLLIFSDRISLSLSFNLGEASCWGSLSIQLSLSPLHRDSEPVLPHSVVCIQVMLMNLMLGKKTLD